MIDLLIMLVVFLGGLFAGYCLALSRWYKRDGHDTWRNGT